MGQKKKKKLKHFLVLIKYDFSLHNIVRIFTYKHLQHETSTQSSFIVHGLGV